MNDQKKAPIVGTRVTFHVAFRNWQGHIDSYTPMGRAVVVTDEGRQFTLSLDQLTMMVDLAKQYTPADAGILAGKRDAALADSPFQYGDAVEVAAVGVPAKVVGILPDGQTLEVVYDDMVGIFKVPAAHTKLVGNTETTLETLVKLLAERDERICDLERQIAALAAERNTTRYALNQIVNYHGSRYTDDADVMREIAEAALDGENIIPRR